MLLQSEYENTLRAVPPGLQTFLRFEQQNLWRIEQFRNPGACTLDRLYLPENGSIFRIPCFLVERRHLFVYGRPDEELSLCDGVELDDPCCQVPFPVHPAELIHYEECLLQTRNGHRFGECERFWATPTSSARTVLAWPEGEPARAFFVKLSMFTQLLGDRRLGRRRVAGSVGLSHLAQESTGALRGDIRLFPEPLGLTLRRLPERGAIYRSIPREIKSGTVIPVPLFALIGGGGKHPPLLLDWAAKGRTDVRAVLEETLLAGFAGLWVDLVFDVGLILEAHGQDLMLGLSEELVPLGGFYYRDFEGLTVDWALRRARGLRDGALPCTVEWFSTYETWGYPRYQLVSHKLFVSLFDYVHLVIAEVEAAMRQWQSSGMMAGEKICEGELTYLFSRCLRRAIENKFGMREACDYDVHAHLARFVIFLMRVRREVIHSSTIGRREEFWSDRGEELRVAHA